MYKKGNLDPAKPVHMYKDSRLRTRYSMCTLVNCYACSGLQIIRAHRPLWWIEPFPYRTPTRLLPFQTGAERDWDQYVLSRKTWPVEDGGPVALWRMSNFGLPWVGKSSNGD